MQRFDEIKELTDEINQNDLTNCLKDGTFSKRFNYFINGIERF